MQTSEMATKLLRWRMDVAVTLLMIVMQSNGTYRRLLDDYPCQGLPLAFAPPAYPCSGSASARLLFLMRSFPSTYMAWASAVAPWNAHLEGAAVGEMWSVVTVSLMMAQLPMLLLVRAGNTLCCHSLDYRSVQMSMARENEVQVVAV